MRIAFESPNQPDVVQLIDELDAYQKPLYPPASHHGIDISALSMPDVLFAVVRDATGNAVGCGAICLTRDHGELKCMYLINRCRGQGIGKQLLAFLESGAQARGCTLFMLETGCLQTEALLLYKRCGYIERQPFGNYIQDPNSIFMEKRIVSPGGQSC